MAYIGEPIHLQSLVYKNEKTLFTILAVVSGIFWFALTLGTLGIALIYLALFYVAYLFAHSALISWIKGNGVKISQQQFPDLQQRFVYSCERLGITKLPELYLIQGNGILNAFATRFRGRDFVVLYSDIVDSMADHPDAINFYIGHELAHIQRKHLKWGAFLAPASILPLIGAAYSRAREYTCDQFGRACCEHADSAFKGLAALSAGHKRWAQLEHASYLAQVSDTKGFWMSFHELVADYPWLVKRAIKLDSPINAVPSRHPFAYLIALFIPRLGVGTGAGGGVIVMVAIIGILAAIAIPAYQEYISRAQIASALQVGHQAANQVADYYYQHQKIAPTLAQAEFTQPLPVSVQDMQVNAENGSISITLKPGQLNGKHILLIPSMGDDQRISWRCTSEDIAIKLLPAECRGQ